MDAAARKHLESLRQLHLQRLRVLEERVATFGFNTPPEVHIEIQNIRAELNRLEIQLSNQIDSSSDLLNSNSLDESYLGSYQSDTSISVPLTPSDIQSFPSKKANSVSSSKVSNTNLLSDRQTIQYAPIVYGRTYEVDYRFLALPEDFTSADLNWAKQYIYDSLSDPDSLADHPRWVLFRDHLHCIVGIACQATQLSSDTSITFDRVGRPFNVFVGYVASLEFAPLPFQSKRVSLDQFRNLYTFIQTHWKAKAYEMSSHTIENYTLELPFEDNAALRPKSAELNFNINQVLCYPEQDRYLMLSAAIRCSEPVSVCLGFASQKKAIKGSFLNITALDITQVKYVEVVARHSSDSDPNQEQPAKNLKLQAEENWPSDQLTITMLGASASGKTSFLIGMYAMLSLGIQGFTLTAEDVNDDLHLGNLWENLIEGGDGRWPSGTSESYEYTFDFQYGLRTLRTIKWLDYRGGAIRDAAEEKDVTNLISYLLKSSCVFLCVPGEWFIHSAALNSHWKITVKRLNLLMKKLYDNLPKEGNLFPVTFVVTKSDLCKHRSYEDLAADIKKMFHVLFIEDAKFLVSICPVSLGYGLAQDQSRGKIDPVNMDIPLLNAVYLDLRNSIGNLKKRINVIENNPISKILKSISPRLCGSELKETTKLLQEMNLAFSKLPSHMKGLNFYIGDTTYYLNDNGELTTQVEE